MAQKTWELSGEYMESCNCDYLCPCIFTNPQAPATHEHCTALMVYRIDRGRHGDISLDGLKFALVIRSGRVMSDGGWVFGCVVDEKASDAQRRALADIVSGTVGGPPQMIRDNLVSDFRGVEFRRIDFTVDGLRRATDIPGVLAFAIEGVASRNRSGEPFYIDNTAHPANRRLALARASKTEVEGFRLELSLLGKGNNGHFAPLPGVPERRSVNRSTPSQTSPLPGLLLSQRVAIVAALAGLFVLCWLYLFGEATQMAAMGQDMVMPPMGANDLLLLLAMWWIMMIGMMLPSAAPMILTFAAINRGRRARRQPYTPTMLFTSGYLLAWGGFSVAATLAQWTLEQASLLSPMAMKITSPLLGGLLFIAAGIYQLTPLKTACLRSCRSPFDFVVNHWRDGAGGALRMGFSHGLYCLGCCWILMALLFAVGAMNLIWIAALAAVVLVEKLFPGGVWIGRIGGLVLIAWGVRLVIVS